MNNFNRKYRVRSNRIDFNVLIKTEFLAFSLNWIASKSSKMSSTWSQTASWKVERNHHAHIAVVILDEWGEVFQVAFSFINAYLFSNLCLFHTFRDLQTLYVNTFSELFKKNTAKRNKKPLIYGAADMTLPLLWKYTRPR